MLQCAARKGFSIAEVLVAMFILLIGIVDVIYLTGRGVTETRSATNAVIATMLAQEGTEFVRNVRDNNVTQTDCGSGSERCTAFYRYFPNVAGGAMTNFCTISVAGSGGDPMTCSGVSSGSGDALFINEATGLYQHQHAGNQTTPFRRRIYIQYTMTNGDPLDQTSSHLVADVTSVVLFSGKEFDTLDMRGGIGAVEEWCKIGADCAFAQTRLTSWINYDN